tara:strand:+ start:1464 stop:2486 length:1023 start_codon:yes stop_codon:yes gene_type:complete
MNKNSRLLYYLKYYKQLSPENFKIKKEGDKIVIEPMDKENFKKGGKVKTWKDKYNEKYGFEKGKSHSLKDIAKTTGISLKGIQQIYDKGIGAYKTNPQSVRPSVKSKEQWAYGRVYSAVMGGKAAKVDAKELKMQLGGQLTYINEIPNSHLDKLERDKGNFEFFDLSDYKEIPYPKIDSAELRSEIFYLNSLPLDEEFVEDGDKVLQNFYNYLRENDLHLTSEQLDDLNDALYQITPIIFELKYFYNRPRPYQVAPKLGLPLKYLEVESAETPAYPSGHSTQGIFIGHFLGDLFPLHRDNLIEIGNNIGISRLIGRLHYPTDDILGKYLGYGLYKYYNGK